MPHTLLTFVTLAKFLANYLVQFDDYFQVTIDNPSCHHHLRHLPFRLVLQLAAATAGLTAYLILLLERLMFSVPAILKSAEGIRNPAYPKGTGHTFTSVRDSTVGFLVTAWNDLFDAAVTGGMEAAQPLDARILAALTIVVVSVGAQFPILVMAGTFEGGVKVAMWLLDST